MVLPERLFTEHFILPHAFFYKQHFISKSFISNTRLKLAKNQAKAKQHPDAKRENYSLSSFVLSSEN